MNKIMGFSGEYGYLSNFYLAPVEWMGIVWPTSENAYQWAKAHYLTDKGPESISLFQSSSAGKAKREGQKFNLDKKAWNKIKFQVMFEIVSAKFEQNPDLLKLLLDTGSKDIVELNNWGDVYWGAVMKDGILLGENNLGEILMLIRSHHRGWGLVWEDV